MAENLTPKSSNFTNSLKHEQVNSSTRTPCRQMGLSRKRKRNSVDVGTPSQMGRSGDDFDAHNKPLQINFNTEESDNVPFKSKHQVNQQTLKRTFQSPVKNNTPTIFNTPSKFVKSSYMRLSQNTDQCSSNQINLNNLTESQIIDEIKVTSKRMRLKENEIEHLNQQDLYRQIHNLCHLNKLIKLWREGCQSALMELFQLYKQDETDMSMTTLLKNLNIPNDLVHYDADLSEFVHNI